MEFEKNLLEVSYNNINIIEAKKEWLKIYIDNRIDVSGTCICQHNIKYKIYMYNIHNNNTIMVGSTCCKKFNFGNKILDNEILREIFSNNISRGEYTIINNILEYTNNIRDQLINLFREKILMTINLDKTQNYQKLLKIRNEVNELIYEFKIPYLNEIIDEIDEKLRDQLINLFREKILMSINLNKTQNYRKLSKIRDEVNELIDEFKIPYLNEIIDEIDEKINIPCRFCNKLMFLDENDKFHSKCRIKNKLEIRNKLDTNCIYCNNKLSSEYEELEYLNDDNSINYIILNNIVSHIKCQKDNNILEIHDSLDKTCIYCNTKILLEYNELDYLNDDNSINYIILNEKVLNNINYHINCYKDNNISEIHNILDKKCIYCNTKLSLEYNDIEYLNDDNSINYMKLNNIEFHIKCNKDNNILEICKILDKKCIYCDNKLLSQYNELNYLNEDNTINLILLNNIKYHTNCYKEL